ncbi:hypothetical protein ACRZ9O_04510 [Aquirufa sp. HETE-40SA]
MKKLILFILLGVSPIVSYGQMAILRDNGTGMPITANPYIGVKGSAYLEDFKKGVLYLNNGLKVEGLQIALNAYSNNLEYKIDGGQFSYGPDKLSKFTYSSSSSGELIEFTSEYEVPTIKKKRFVQVIEKGKYSLLFHPYKVMTDDPSATYGAQAAKVFQDEQDVFVAIDGKVYLLKNKEKILKEVFGTDAEKAIAFIKTQKVNFKEMNELKALIQELNKK